MQRNEEILNKIYWDYNVSPKKLYDIIMGKISSDLFFTKERIFIRMLERLSWYEVLEILSIDSVKVLLTKDIISKIRFAELREKYEFIRKILSGEPVSFTGWGDEYYKKIKHTLFSNRWYSAKPPLL